ncbi:MAG: hypothetical protein QMD23_00105 [Candidatus Bathyarchaeia archaeon]|nr:hypothetical protein [Candidatus Bathyarchaeia archaeon]
MLKKSILLIVFVSLIAHFNPGVIVAQLQVNSDDIEMISYRGLKTNDFYLIFGELRNNRNTAVRNVTIEIYLLDNGGALIDEIYAKASLDVVPPKRRSPFVEYYMNKTRLNKIQNFTINGIIYNDCEEKPKALALVYYTFYDNGIFATHILNNSTWVLGVSGKKATNNIKVVATLYAGKTIACVSAGFLKLPGPGLLWDVVSNAPLTIEFGSPFLESDLANADMLIASVESPDFSAQHEILGYKINNVWEWTTSEAESHSKPNNMIPNSLIVLIVISVFTVVIFVTIYFKKREKRRIRTKKIKKTQKKG